MQTRKPYLYEAILSFSFLIVCMAIGIAVYGANPHIPMLIGTAFASVMALRMGYKWSDIEDSMFKGILQAMQAIIILAIIGILIGVWLKAGVVPTMIYYGLKIISPQIFLVASLIICSITSLATGTSWGTAGTIGVALMGVAGGLGIPAPIAAGAIISGSYFGDKMSPLSDTTNLAPAMAGTDVFTHVKFMFKPTAIAYAITLVFFAVVGMRFNSASVDMEAIEVIKNGIYNNFKITPLLFLPPLVVILSIAKKMPAIPGIFLGIILGAVLGVILQGASFGEILEVGYDGYVSTTGIVSIDELLTTGGLTNMFFSISLTIFAMMFGGIMERTGQLEVIVEKLVKNVKSDPGLVGLTMATCLASNMTMPEQYIAVVLPGRMYAQTYHDRGLHPKTLSNALESSGTLVSALVPWNTCGAFLTGVLGVSTFAYAPWAMFNYLMPVVTLVLAFMGVTIAKIKDDPDTVISSGFEAKEAA